mgnify:CR=1 FL=1
MLKLTEAELAEFGFGREPMRFYRPSGEGGVVYLSHSNYWCVEADSYSGSAIYPQTKEDLLTLIRLFTPPKGQS